jgi:hypothetical protein
MQPSGVGAVSFSGAGSTVTGPLGSLTLTSPSATSIVINGGSLYGGTTVSGSTASLVLFPPTPTSWRLTDAAHDQQLEITVVSETTRNLMLTITQISTHELLSLAALDQSGSGTITYSDSTSAAISNWTLAD